ncbi:hypothetical protein CLPU_2c02120 [Gottschalkia purinilytica]|uniref:UspA domain-containing protein n=1 Tax=Gottschalkia purinilytica TaxID=1503 RepID=A0A0L0WEA8_GOTPU|nr:universal stress protein [Gottschalkia purinilytica]KNF09760.1 hypothetical protein CLPU_2c02120 [Gottschalkia purinilytica]
MKILIPIDGSERSMKSFDTLKSMYKPEDVSVTVMHVDEVVIYGGIDLTAERMEISKEISQDILNKACERISEFNPDKCYAVGYPHKEILEKAKEGYDMIIMTKSGKSGLDRLLIGSVTTKIIHKSNINVLIVPN